MAQRWHTLLPALALFACAGPDDTGEPKGAPCPTSAQLGTLGAYTDELVAITATALEHAFPQEAVGALTLPGWSASMMSFAFLYEPCSEPGQFEAFCAGGTCQQLECTQHNASWANHTSLDGPWVEDGWTWDQASLTVSWDETSDEVGVAVAGAGTSPTGEDWSFDGESSTTSGTVGLRLSLPSLLEQADPLVVAVSRDLDSHEEVATMHLGDRLVAEVEDGDFALAGTCR